MRGFTERKRKCKWDHCFQKVYPENAAPIRNVCGYYWEINSLRFANHLCARRRVSHVYPVAVQWNCMRSRVAATVFVCSVHKFGFHVLRFQGSRGSKKATMRLRMLKAYW